MVWLGYVWEVGGSWTWCSVWFNFLGLKGSLQEWLFNHKVNKKKGHLGCMLTFIECEVDSCCFGFCAVTLMMFLGLYVNLITFAWWLWSSDLFIVLCCLIWTNYGWTDSWFLYFKSLLKEWFELECYFELLLVYDLKLW